MADEAGLDQEQVGVDQVQAVERGGECGAAEQDAVWRGVLELLDGRAEVAGAPSRS